MNLMSIVNIYEDRKERKTTNVSEVSAANKDYGYSVYESLEYVKNNPVMNNNTLQMEMMKNFIR